MLRRAGKYFCTAINCAPDDYNAGNGRGTPCMKPAFYSCTLLFVKVYRCIECAAVFPDSAKTPLKNPRT